MNMQEVIQCNMLLFSLFLQWLWILNFKVGDSKSKNLRDEDRLMRLAIDQLDAAEDISRKRSRFWFLENKVVSGRWSCVGVTKVFGVFAKIHENPPTKSPVFSVFWYNIEEKWNQVSDVVSELDGNPLCAAWMKESCEKQEEARGSRFL